MHHEVVLERFREYIIWDWLIVYFLQRTYFQWYSFFCTYWLINRLERFIYLSSKELIHFHCSRLRWRTGFPPPAASASDLRRTEDRRRSCRTIWNSFHYNINIVNLETSATTLLLCISCTAHWNIVKNIWYM